LWSWIDFIKEKDAGWQMFIETVSGASELEAGSSSALGFRL
jgi:hypothetical protein